MKIQFYFSCLITLLVSGMLYSAVTTPSPVKGLWIAFVAFMLAAAVGANVIIYKECRKSGTRE